MDNNGASAPAPPAEMPSPASTPNDNGGSSSQAVKAQLTDARADLDTAARDVEDTQGDCANVCRALVSLERVTVHFCALATSDSDRNACEDAKVRVYKARARIKASCGTCANGAPLDEHAPLNSR